jgi:hypothetical protein
MASVNFNGNNVTDEEIKNVLQAIADVLGRNVNVSSGDRRKPLDVGAGKGSHHLIGTAADFHVQGLTDEMAYQKIKRFHESIFARGNRYELIWHGPNTGTKGQHVHISRFKNSSSGSVECMKEGDRPQNKNKYWTDNIFHINWGRGSYPGSKKDPTSPESIWGENSYVAPHL